MARKLTSPGNTVPMPAAKYINKNTENCASSRFWNMGSTITVAAKCITPKSIKAMLAMLIQTINDFMICMFLGLYFPPAPIDLSARKILNTIYTYTKGVSFILL